MAKSGSGERRPTIYDVARHAEVSHQTVSRYIKGQTNIAPELVRRVEIALKDLDYRPNLTARNLAKQRSSTVGVLTFDLAEYGPSQTILGIIEVARDAGFLVDLMSVVAGDRSSLTSAVHDFEQRDLAGLLVMAPTDSLLGAIEGVALPAATYVWQEADDSLPGRTATVNELGQEELVEHLADLGHRRFFALHGPSEWISARHRADGLHAALSRRDAVLVGEATGDWTARSGYDAVLRAKDLPDATALVCANDQMALGALMALRERGISVPGRMSVVGFDDIPESAYFFPPLTTVRQDFLQQGRVAMTRLLRLLTPAVEAPMAEQAVPRLVVRESTSPSGS